MSGQPWLTSGADSGANWGSWNNPMSVNLGPGGTSPIDPGVSPMSVDGGFGNFDTSSIGAPASSGVLGTGMNGMQFAGDILGGLKTLGGLYLGIRQLGLANKQFKFSKAYANANLANQTQSYNTALTDRANSRAAMEGLSPAQAQSYISQNSLKSVNLGS